MSANPWRLLVVDDNEDNRLTLTERLAREGYRNVTMASNGRQALELIRSEAFDLVLLDIMMPEMNGYQVLEELRADPKQRMLPVIVISAIDQMQSAIRCIELGAEDYLPKPFNPILLRARIGAILEKKRLHDELARHVARLDRELKLARDIQLSMVPSDFPAAAAAVAIDAILQPAREVGGDFYDFFWISPERLCLVVADVSDKGMPAALFMARTKTAIRMVATLTPDHCASARTLIAQINDELCRDNPHAMYVALVLCIVDVRSGTAEWCNAGQAAPYIVAPEGRVERRSEEIGCPLGLPVPFDYAGGTTTLAPGSSIVLNTDGITEAMNSNGGMFGEARLYSALSAAAAKEPREMLADVLAQVKTFRGSAEPSDDIAAVICRLQR